MSNDLIVGPFDDTDARSTFEIIEDTFELGVVVGDAGADARLFGIATEDDLGPEAEASNDETELVVMQVLGLVDDDSGTGVGDALDEAQGLERKLLGGELIGHATKGLEGRGHEGFDLLSERTWKVANAPIGLDVGPEEDDLLGTAFGNIEGREGDGAKGLPCTGRAHEEEDITRGPKPLGLELAAVTGLEARGEGKGSSGLLHDETDIG